MNPDNSFFERGTEIYPQPVALSCGRICRSKTPQERLDAILRCAEVLTRYLAALAIASFAARDDQAVSAPDALGKLNGNLSFGHFLSAVQGVAGANGEHPLRAGLVASFKSRDGDSGPADAAIISLLNLRNGLGHDLNNMSEARATTVFNEKQPDIALQTALESLDQLLRLPLFLVEEQRLVSKKPVARRLLLMGESADPLPEEVELSDGLEFDRALYVGLNDGALCLRPLLHWDIVQQRSNYGIYFLHAINKELTFITIHSERKERNGVLASELQQRISGTLIAKESISLRKGSSFVREWSDRRRGIEQELQLRSGLIPWGDLDPATLRWYGAQLGLPAEEEAIRSAISERLLDSRDRLLPEEVRQLVLLFGTEPAVRGRLGRGMIDCRAIEPNQPRPKDRAEATSNVIESLKLAIIFFGQHVAVGETTIDGLRATAGSADYIAMREALVNLFIHQDYSDQRSVAQIEIRPERAMFFNAGKSLVSSTSLAEGGKSQSRNPLISRALRLIGFAELAGSGLRAIYHAWAGAKRRPPVYESNSSANSFTLILDWRPMIEIADSFWKQRLGVSISPQESATLILAAEPDGVTIERIAAAQSLLLNDVKSLVQRLVKEGMVVENKGVIKAQEHLQNLVDEAKRQP